MEGSVRDQTKAFEIVLMIIDEMLSLYYLCDAFLSCKTLPHFGATLWKSVECNSCEAIGSKTLYHPWHGISRRDAPRCKAGLGA